MQRREKIILGALAAIGGFWALSAFGKSANIDPDSIPEGDAFPQVDFGLLDSVEEIMPSTNWKRNDYPKYASAIAEAERQNGIPQDLLARLLFQESHFLPNIISGEKRSPVGAMIPVPRSSPPALRSLAKGACALSILRNAGPTATDRQACRV